VTRGKCYIFCCLLIRRGIWSFTNSQDFQNDMPLDYKVLIRGLSFTEVADVYIAIQGCNENFTDAVKRSREISRKWSVENRGTFLH
jgi:hypothetical protein